MLKNLSIKNFQKHGNLEIKLAPITTIVGSSDKGKSSIIRALKWVLLNQPNGFDFLKEGEKETEVTLQVDKSIVTRFRTKSENSYGLNSEEFKSFGGNVPEPISKVCNVNALNFQNQHDSPFWFTLSSAEVSRQLNSIVNLEVIDKVQALSSQEVRKIQGQISECNSRLSDSEREISKLSSVKKYVKAIGVIEVQYKKIEQLSSKITRLEKVINQVNHFRSKIKKSKKKIY